MATTFAAHILGPDDHASLPSASTVPYGAIYACTDHDKLYRNNDGTWGDYFEGGGGGDITTDAAWAAKGDLIAATGNDAAAVVTVGANGSILEAQSGQSSGIKWSKMQSDKVTRTAGNLTYTSSTFADVTGMSITLTTGARRCLVVVTATGKHSANTFGLTLDIDIDGTRQGAANTWGLMKAQAPGNNYELPMSFSYITDVLSAGSHTFKLQAATDGATATLYASDPPLFFAVHELA